MSHGSLDHNAAFRLRLLRGDVLVGTFVKTPHPAIVEVLGRSDLDFLILDAEHAPFDRTTIDICLLAGHGCRCPVLVRVPQAAPEWIMASLDAGAAGIMAPHVSCAAGARDIADMMRYAGGRRGFSPSPRAGDYGGRSISEHLALAPAETVLVCQIEDRGGVEAAGAIAAVDGVDALFVGPVDLAVSLGLDSAADDAVAALCRRTIAAARPGARSGLFVSSMDSAPAWLECGATLIVSGSDQAMLRAGAKALVIE
jgi:2-keto-3-deoxy-L-rhamnonate aldolase RhmA